MGYTTSELKHRRCCCRAIFGDSCIWLGVHIRLWLGSERVEKFWKKAWLSISPSNPSSLYLIFSLAHHQFTLHTFTHSRMNLSAPYIFNLLAKWQSGGGFSSLGGHRKSLALGLFAARHYTWAETLVCGRRQMCPLVGGWLCGWMQYGASTNKTQRIMENSQDAFHEDVKGFTCCQSMTDRCDGNLVYRRARSEWELLANHKTLSDRNTRCGAVLWCSILQCNFISTSIKMILLLWE